MHTGRTGHEYLVLETDDAIEYRATVLDPDEAKGLMMAIELSGSVTAD